MNGTVQRVEGDGRVPASGWPMIRSMVGTGLLCGLLIVAVFQLTLPVIQRNRAEALERAILRVLPEAGASAPFRFEDAGGFQAVPAGSSGERLVFAGYDAGGRLAGVALEASGMGYQDTIRLLYGYSPELEAVVGVQVLESRETPGLGDRIENDPQFLANFERLDVTLAGDGAEVAHPIEPVKHGDKQHPWQVDGITGATISSEAVADILRASTRVWVPRIRRHLDDLRRDAPGALAGGE